MYASILKRYKTLTTFDARSSKIMDASTIESKFLPKSNELGLVAVGFSGGQVRLHWQRCIFADLKVHLV